QVFNRGLVTGSGNQGKVFGFQVVHGAPLYLVVQGLAKGRVGCKVWVVVDVRTGLQAKRATAASSPSLSLR
ncbi:hypothetical protein, partial [Yoonia sp.]|uniref:hypothetical protein n=1 Tax=Yoonia sp. TaxID=2212373 RepID=UPI003A4DD20B